MAEQKGDRFIWWIAGAAMGATFALLFAPYSGKELRRRLHRLAEESREALVESGQEALEQGKEAIHRGKKAVVDEALDFVERGRRKILR